MSFMQPLVIRNEDTLKTLAEDMKLCMSEDPTTSLDLPEGYKYSATPEEAIVKAAKIQTEIYKKTGKSMWEQGGHRLILFHGHLITLALSLDEFETPPSWHLSMGLVMMNSEPGRVPDKFANAIAKAFFPAYNEQNPKQALSKVRHFLSPAPKKEAVNVPDPTPESPAAN
jgi:hypothetical protein